MNPKINSNINLIMNLDLNLNVIMNSNMHSNINSNINQNINSNINLNVNRYNLDYIVDEICSRMRENCTPSTTHSFPSFLSTSSSSTLSSSSSSSSSNFWNLNSRVDRSHLVIDFVFSTLGKQELSVLPNSTVSLFTDYEILKGKASFYFQI